MSGTPRGLQGLINIVGHYGQRYRLIFGAEKTKVTVTGSRHDMQYYKDNSIWSLYEEKITVAENNDHLGLVVSGYSEELKNVDKNIKSARDSLFNFLGNIFAYKCKLSQKVQYHTWQVFIKPVLRSGLAALPIRPVVMQPLIKFHHKILRAILKLSKYSPVAPLYFLLGEPPLEASLHLDILSVFWNIWVNPQTKVFQVLKYLLMMSGSTSLTWSAHVFQLYSLPDPLLLLDTTPWTKERWKNHTSIAVLSHHESVLRRNVIKNRKLQYLNVQCTGLTSRPHPVLSWLLTTQDVDMVRPHIKMLAGDYLCYSFLAHDRGLDPQCRLCQGLLGLPAPAEDYEHLLTMCKATANSRVARIPTLLNMVAHHNATNAILKEPSSTILTQFLLDCSSLNLPTDVRIDPALPGFSDIAKQCYSQRQSATTKDLGSVRLNVSTVMTILFTCDQDQTLYTVCSILPVS